MYLSSDPVKLPFEDGSFDAVLSLGVLEHVAHPDQSLDELKRILEPRGTLYVFKLPNRYSYLEKLAKLIGLYYHGAEPADVVDTKRSALALLRSHGFEVREFRRANMLPRTLEGRVATRAAGSDLDSEPWSRSGSRAQFPCYKSRARRDRSMRIALVYDCLFPYTVGGAERRYRNLAERLAAGGYDVTYLTMRQWEPGSEPDIPGVEVVAVGPRMPLYFDGRRRLSPPIVFGLGSSPICCAGAPATTSSIQRRSLTSPFLLPSPCADCAASDSSSTGSRSGHAATGSNISVLSADV